MGLSHSNGFKCTIINHHFNYLVPPFNIIFIHLVYNYLKDCVLPVCFLLPVWQQVTCQTSTHIKPEILAEPNSQTREREKLGVNFANINNSHVTHSKSKDASQTPGQAEGSLSLPVWVENNSNDQGPVPGTAISPSLHSLILENSQYITLNDAGQHSTRMRCYFHSKQNCFLDYFDDSVPDGAVIYAGDILYKYSEKQGTYTEVRQPNRKLFPGCNQGPWIFTKLQKYCTMYFCWIKKVQLQLLLIQAQQATCHYHLLIQVTHYIKYIMSEKETLRPNM